MQIPEAIFKVVPIVFRPRLHIVNKGDRRRETVAIQYPPQESLLTYAATATTASFGPFVGSPRIGRAIYIRAWVYNYWCLKANGVSVLVDSIIANGKSLEQEKPPLHWADTEKEFSVDLRFGYRNGRYIDICSADGIDKKLHVISSKWYKGYHRFPDSGIYTIGLVAVGEWPCSKSRFSISVEFVNQKWDSLKVISTTEDRKWLRLW